MSASHAPRETLERAPASWRLRVCVTAVVVLFAGWMCFLLWLRWRAAAWATPREIGLSPLAGAAGVGLLVAAARRRARPPCTRFARTWLWRTCLGAAVVLAGLFVGLRSSEYRGLYERGLWQFGTLSAVHQRPDLYYVQAVRLRLAELFRELEERRANAPLEFSTEDQQRLGTRLVPADQHDLVDRARGGSLA